MKNLTITLDEEIVRWARVEAARREVSVSGLVRTLLRDHMTTEHGYDAAMSRYLGRPPRPLKTDGGYPSRDDLHDRANFR